MVDRQQIFAVLIGSATVLFVAAGAPGFRYRRQVRIAAVAVYGVALVVVLAWVAMWLAGADIRR
jgi:hypothetical protein